MPKLIAKIKTTVQTAQNFIKQINNILQVFVFQAKATFLKFQHLKWLQSISDTETNDWSKKKKLPIVVIILKFGLLFSLNMHCTQIIT